MWDFNMAEEKKKTIINIAESDILWSENCDTAKKIEKKDKNCCKRRKYILQLRVKESRLGYGKNLWKRDKRKFYD